MVKRGTQKEEKKLALVINQDVVDSLRENYMPYAMSVIVSRAIPEIDGFKPAHRKLLYTMYKMGLLRGPRTKSANIVGQTMKLNPHGDAAIYETMVRMARGNETLLVPFVDSKGNFGKVYSRDMAYAASRYTEAKLEKICEEIFRGIDENAVDMVDNYDGTMKEPALLPTTYPNILVNANVGIAVGMASSVCSFNLKEVCETAIAFIQDPDCDLQATLPAPDFSTGGEILLDKKNIRQIYETGRGSIPVRAVWNYQKKGNLIEITEIPYTTTIEAIMDKAEDLLKANKFPEITDIRDESDLKGLKLTIDLKRGSDPNLVMARLMKQTPLQDNFACNFNVLINGRPETLGIRSILEEWIKWRVATKKRIYIYEIAQMSHRLHLLEGLHSILLDIDRAIQIIRDTKKDSLVIENLMDAFSIDREQAEYVAEIKLRNLNQEYILKQTKGMKELAAAIKKLNGIVKSDRKIEDAIVQELRSIINSYGADRKSKLIDSALVEVPEEKNLISSYKAMVYVSHEGYVKTQRAKNQEQKWKDGDYTILASEAESTQELWVFTDAGQLYKVMVAALPDVKPSQTGEYLPSILKMDDGERVQSACIIREDQLYFFFADGHGVSIPTASYETKTTRKKIKNAVSLRAPLIGVVNAPAASEKCYLLHSNKRTVSIKLNKLTKATTKNSFGSIIAKPKKEEAFDEVKEKEEKEEKA